MAKNSQAAENNTSFGNGPEDAVVNNLSIKPVYPVNLGKLTLINRAILPIIYQGERVKGEGSEFGLRPDGIRTRPDPLRSAV